MGSSATPSATTNNGLGAPASDAWRSNQLEIERLQAELREPLPPPPSTQVPGPGPPLAMSSSSPSMGGGGASLMLGGTSMAGLRTTTDGLPSPSHTMVAGVAHKAGSSSSTTSNVQVHRGFDDQIAANQDMIEKLQRQLSMPSSMPQSAMQPPPMQQYNMPQSAMQPPPMQQYNMPQSAMQPPPMQQYNMPQSAMQPPPMQQYNMPQSAMQPPPMQQPGMQNPGAMGGSSNVSGSAFDFM